MPQFFNWVQLSGFLVRILAVGVAAMGLPAIAESSPKSPRQVSAVSAPAVTLPDGVYLYGQSPKPEQIGKGYFVFEVNHGKVVGALYMPRSSFDCAAGSFQGNQLALTVVNSYDRSTNPFDIALERGSTVAATGGGSEKVSLQGFHQISSISQNDYRILNTCKADLQK
ncbi:hypothetical protein [Leptothermofonsia sp. ETS-13]|uniref:hypothetical protein n=1 Tax=Leptothermofonsia sp. ETS-13 TaxID=3035696 RepID=UPI003B9E4EA9